MRIVLCVVLFVFTLVSMADSKQPVITSVSWGKIYVQLNEESEPVRFKDVIISPTGAKNWDWSITGTQHNPGIQIGDVQELVEESGVEIIVLSKGMEQILKTRQETLDYLEKKGIQVIHEPTRTAVEKYNEIIKTNSKVGGVFHSTC